MNNDWTAKQFSGKSGIEKALNRLSAKMAYAGLEPVELVSCGGAALNLMGWVSRSTSDVDVLCVIQLEGGGMARLLSESTVPSKFAELVAEVGFDLGLDEAWLNFGPAPLMEFGLPDGLETRLTRVSYGPCLALHLIGRLDQIHLKLFAVMDPNTRIETHLGDLLDLEPTEAEARAAAAWLLNRKTSGDFRRKLQQALDRIGHEHVAQTL